MQDRNERKKNLPIGKVIALLIALFALPSELIGLVIILGIVGFAFYIGFRAAKSRTNAPKRKPDNFDECPQSIFCFHKDKGEHHVRKGREIDPWDRPDIDISKYQRRS